MMNGFYAIDETSTDTLPFAHVNETSEHGETIKSILLTENEKTVANDCLKYSSVFNGAALTPNELAILWDKFRKHGHFRVEDDSITQIEYPSTASLLQLYSQSNNNFINRDQQFSQQCDTESNDTAVDSNSFVVDIHREMPVHAKSSSHSMTNYPQHELYENNFFNTPNLSSSDDQSEFIINDGQYSFIDISNNKYQREP